MKRSWIAIGVLVLAAALFSAGLARKLVSMRSGDAPTRNVITVIPKGVDSPWWNQVRLGAEAALVDSGYRLNWTGPEQESDHARQIACIEDALVRNAAALVIAPNDSKVLVRPVMDAAKRMPCVIIDSPLARSGGLPLVATDNYAAGELAARVAAHVVGGHGRILIVNHLRNSESTVERSRGFVATMRKEYPDIKLVEMPFEENLLRDVRRMVTDYLAREPDIDAVFAVNLSTSEGAYRAILNEGKEDHLRLIAFDSSAPLLDGMRRGTVAAIVVQNPFEIGRRGVLRALDVLNGVSGEAFTPIPVFVVDPSNQKEMERAYPDALGL